MSPSPRRQAITVGLFVTAAVVLMSGSILMVGDLNDTFTRKIQVSVVFDEVSGLKRGDNIWFSGVKVGIVKGLGFRGPGEVEVMLKIDRDATEYIHSDVWAKIGSDGLIGNRIVVLYGGDESGPTLVEGDVLRAAGVTSTDEMMEVLQQNNQNLLAITADLSVVTGALAAGEGSIGRLLGEDTLYDSALASTRMLEVATDHAAATTTSLKLFAAKLNQPGTLPHDLVTDRTSYTTLTSTVTQLRATGDRAGELVDGLAASAANEKTPLGTLLHDERAGSDLAGTLAGMNKSSDLLKEDLTALQSNIFFRRYFKKKARAEEKAREAAEKAAKGR